MLLFTRKTTDMDYRVFFFFRATINTITRSAAKAREWARALSFAALLEKQAACAGRSRRERKHGVIHPSDAYRFPPIRERAKKKCSGVALCTAVGVCVCFSTRWKRRERISSDTESTLCSAAVVKIIFGRREREEREECCAFGEILADDGRLLCWVGVFLLGVYILEAVKCRRIVWFLESKSC